jgi:hypothetical protein
VAGAAADGRQPDVIHRDVCVIGGGSSGTYAAIRLRDLGRSVALVELAGRLGGHTETFHDPATGGTTDIGVIVFHDLPLVREYLARFDVPLVTFGGFGGGPTRYVDFRTGREVAGYLPPQPTALPAYLELLQRYPYLEDGFDLPDPVPAELLIPFGEFVRRHALDSIVPTVFNFGQGLGDLLRQPTVYVLKNFGIGVVQNVFAGSFLTTARGDNAELYERATADLGADALLDTRVLAVDRSGSSGVRVLVRTPHGRRLIVAKRLVVTFPPLPGGLAGFDLDTVERSLFGQFRPGFYYTGVLRLSGVPADLRVQNTGADTEYHLPPLPGLYAVYPAGIPGLHQIKYGSTVPLSDEQVRRNVAADIRRLAAAGTLPARLERVEKFKSHSPFELTVPASRIKAGFYRDLAGLQGRHHTFYTGAAFHTHDSSLLWQFTERLLPAIAA